jgi:hypothetical protein
MISVKRTSSVRTIFLIATAVLVSVPAWVRIACAQPPPPAADAKPAATTATPTPPTGWPPVVAEGADRLLRQTGEYIGSAEQFTFHADITFDHVLCRPARSCNIRHPRM